jgi:HEAT repeat protein
MAFSDHSVGRRRLIVASYLVLLIVVVDVFSGGVTGKFYRGRHWVWEWNRFGPWISFPPLRTGFRQQRFDFSSPVPPAFIPDQDWARDCWDQLHQLYLLDQKGKERAFTDKEIDELAKLADYPDEWYIRSKALNVIWGSKNCEDPDRQARLFRIPREHLNDPEPKVRGTAALCLADRFKTRDVIPAILGLLTRDAPAHELCDCIRALGKLCEGAQEPALVTIPSIEKVVPVIASLLKHNSDIYQQPAAYLLGQIGPKAAAAVPALQEAKLAAEKEEENCRRQGRDIDRFGKHDRSLCEEINHSLQLIMDRSKPKN